MKNPAARIWNRLGRDTHGAEIAETAMIIPLLFMILMAIFWFGQAFRIYGAISHAAREGARSAITPVCTTCAAGTSATQNAINSVDSALAAAHLSISQVQGPSPVPSFCPCGSPSSSCASSLKVKCDTSVSSSNVCVQPNVQLSDTSSGGAGTCGTSVSFGYQNAFTFVIPFTNLDLGKMSLPAQAEMRMETQ